MRLHLCKPVHLFLLTCLLRGMTKLYTDNCIRFAISTHMPLARHDFSNVIWYICNNISTHMPLARHDPLHLDVSHAVIAISTHMPLARHDPSLSAGLFNQSISTHMPLARHDYLFAHPVSFRTISTHMPLARHDQIHLCTFHHPFNFYSHASCEA